MVHLVWEIYVSSGYINDHNITWNNIWNSEPENHVKEDLYSVSWWILTIRAILFHLALNHSETEKRIGDEYSLEIN